VCRVTPSLEDRVESGKETIAGAYMIPKWVYNITQGDLENSQDA